MHDSVFNVRHRLTPWFVSYKHYVDIINFYNLSKVRETQTLSSVFCVGSFRQLGSSLRDSIRTQHRHLVFIIKIALTRTSQLFQKRTLKIMVQVNCRRGLI